MTDREFLRWIRDRLEFVHGENPSFDYMLKLAEIDEDQPLTKRTNRKDHA